MTEQFASIELASLYESQGYVDDALAMYNSLAQEGSEEIRDEARQALSRLAGKSEVKEDEAREISSPEHNISRLLEEWVTLILVEKRVNVFKTIKGRF